MVNTQTVTQEKTGENAGNRRCLILPGDTAGEAHITAGENADREAFWQWLCACPILTRREILSLVDYFGSPEKVYMASSGELDRFVRLGLKWPKSLITYKNSCTLEKSRQLLEARGMSFLSRENAMFPDRLRNLPDCPYGLFYKGKLPDPDVLSVAIIGARRCSNYGSRMAAYLGAQFAKRHVQVISGMAAGIDGLAQKACVEEGGSSFAVLGCGADICYPPENNRLYRKLQEKGGIISEYGPATPPLPGNFPIRNRLISGLADAVVVVEARKQSGSLITVDLALDQGRDVYAVPGRFGDELSYGCNHLIEQGASLLTSVDQLIDEMKDRMPGKKLLVPGLGHTAEQVIRAREHKQKEEEEKAARRKEEAGRTELTEQEQQIFQKLDMDSKPFDQLMEETGLSMMQLMEGLLALQMKNYVQEVSRNRYIRTKVC